MSEPKTKSKYKLHSVESAYHGTAKRLSVCRFVADGSTLVGDNCSGIAIRVASPC